MKVAVDAMGGDSAPHVVVQGAIGAASELGIEIILVGDERAVSKELEGSPARGNMRIHHCTEVVRMEESPLKALRQKKDASIAVAFELVKAGKVDAVVSAGNSGATLAAGVLTLGRLKGVERPAIAGILPGQKGPVVLIDVGANVDCRPAQLFQFAVMAHIFAVSCLSLRNPKIGLLNIGEEGGKGNELVRAAHELLEKSELNYVGNVEGRDIFRGEVQIIVCDGFVGNVALKLSEGMAEIMGEMVKRELLATWPGRAAALLGRGSFARLRRALNYEEQGGAPLLGINGVGIVCHGGSSPLAIKNAIRLAANYVNNHALEKMTEAFRAFSGAREIGVG
jgi:phosphate acyltransferase